MVRLTQEKSVGIVKTKYFKIEEDISLESGKRLGPITIAYETYGELNENKSNAILIFHALSGDAHAAGYHSKDDEKTGWWDTVIGPDKAFDTNKYFIICINAIGGCKGSTGPSSTNPKTGKPYGRDFPIITVKDIINVQKKLIDNFGIKKLFAVSGGSLGGMEALQWAISFPDTVELVIPIATAASQSTQNIAFHDTGRKAIITDPNWNNGDYYSKEPPKHGLAVARMVSHITYLSDYSMKQKFGRGLQDKDKLDFNFGVEFKVESYLRYKGDSFVDRFDANSYLYITRAIDYFDLTESGKNKLEDILSNVKSKFLIISFTSDWLYTTAESEEIVRALQKNGADVIFFEIDSPYGHDAFLLKNDTQTNLIKNFLANNYNKDINKSPIKAERFECKLVLKNIAENSKVLDLGCGEGRLLKILKDEKNIDGRGIEIKQNRVEKCVEKGLSVLHGDLDEGLNYYKDKSFDYVIFNQTIQVVKNSLLVLKEALRVGKKVIVSFPNFGHWNIRTSFSFSGRAPKSRVLPFEWYNTPNIRVLTVKDFRDLCEKNNIRIIKEYSYINKNGKNKIVKILPNLLSTDSLFILEEKRGGIEDANPRETSRKEVTEMNKALSEPSTELGV